MTNSILASHQDLSESPFDSIRRFDKDGNEFWSGRDLQLLLGYSKWENFHKNIKKASLSCRNGGNVVTDHFILMSGNSIGRPKDDWKLSRFACYLVAQNGDPEKPEIAAAQAYFSVMTHKAETAISAQTDRVTVLPELSRLDILRMALDSEEKRIEAENKLAIASQKIEVMTPLAKLGECMTTHEKDTKTIGEIAQSYGIGRSKFFEILRKISFIQQASTRPYQCHIDEGHCEVVMVSRPHKPTKLDPVCVVTMKGQAYIAKKLAELERQNKTEVLLEKTVALV